MITLVMSAVIGSDRSRVWRALTDPSERLGWDERILAAVDAPDVTTDDLAYPRAGSAVRWRYRLGSVQLVMKDRPVDVVPMERLRTQLSLGSLRLDQTYNLAEQAGDASRTRLGMKIVAQNSVPVLGEIVDRFSVRRMAADHIDETLRSVQRWCESDATR